MSGSGKETDNGLISFTVFQFYLFYPHGPSRTGAWQRLEKMYEDRYLPYKIVGDIVKFEIGDSIDRNLTIALRHEFMLCEESFNVFHLYASQNILGDERKKTILKAYSAYASFLSHLYELYYGFFMRERRNTKGIFWRDLDSLFNTEAEKSIRRRRIAIENGYAPKWENPLSYYQKDVPTDFGKHFRAIRNRTSHVSIKRASGEEISLSEYYKKYHMVTLLLYQDAMKHWSTTDVEAVTWDSIERFSFAVKERGKSRRQPVRSVIRAEIRRMWVDLFEMWMDPKNRV